MTTVRESPSVKEIILNSAEEAIRAIQLLKTPEVVDFIGHAGQMLADCFRGKGKVLIAGNGGSLCDAMHFAEELTGIYRQKRPALPAIALSDPGHMSCVGNDLGYDFVFSRAIEALGQTGDVAIFLTTSGNSSNLVQAVKVAREKGLKTIAFLGKTGGKLKGMTDLEWIISGFPYSDRVQELQMTALHMVIGVVEGELFA
jgi:D-sedoheptulose 7-phosphate isomerase